MVVSYAKRNYNRRAAVSIQDALVDLLHLAQCEEVLGSFWSAFTDLAAWYRLQPVRVVHRPLDRDDRSQLFLALQARVLATSRYPW